MHCEVDELDAWLQARVCFERRWRASLLKDDSPAQVLEEGKTFVKCVPTEFQQNFCL